jgi:hypothetical protein
MSFVKAEHTAEQSRGNGPSVDRWSYLIKGLLASAFQNLCSGNQVLKSKEKVNAT